MSEARNLQAVDFDARARQVLSQEPLLSAKDVEVTFSLRGNKLVAIRRASLDLYEGETLAIVGESGSGKSVFPRAAYTLLFPAVIVSIITITFYLVGNAFSDSCDPRNHV